MFIRWRRKYGSNMRRASLLSGGRSQLLLLLLMPYTNVTQIGSRHADYQEWQNVTVRLRKTIEKQTKPNNLLCFRLQQ